MTRPSRSDTIFLAPTDTLRVWDERGELRPTVNWSEMMHEEHASAFTVAKIAQLDLLTRIRESLDDVIRNGGTFEQWKKAILPELQRAGWWGVVQNRDLTGTDDSIVVNDRRLRTIYRTNVRMSIAAGRWRKYQREKDLFPYLRYQSDHYRKHPRLNHKALHDVILPIDHPAWQWMFPPNGWGCNCRVEQVSEARMQREGWSVSDRADELANPPTRPFTRADGSTLDVPTFVQPGFGYNPGTAHLQVVAESATAGIARALDVGLDDAAQATLRAIIDDPAFEQFLAKPHGAFPVAILRPDDAAIIGAQSRLTMLPQGVYAKQLGERPEISPGHPELTIANYRLLPDIIARAVVIARQGDDRLIYFADEGGNLWKAVVRQDAGERYPAIVSFHRSRERNMRAETHSLEILLDRRQ